MADYIIDLGKEGGKAGGNILFSGSPEELAECSDSYTGKYLAPELKR
jgi:excinuclease ABC subunit A